MGDLQRKIAQEEKRQALSRLNDRLGLSTTQGKEMENFDAGIKSTDYDYDGTTRSQRMENIELQKEKLRKNLLKLFGDDDESVGISYSYIVEDPEDVKFFNMNFNKIYGDLNNMYDLDYLNGDTLNRFFERYKLKYNDDKFGIDIFDNMDEEKEIVQQSEKATYQTPVPSQIYGNGTPQNQTPQNETPQNQNKEIEELVIDYVSVTHREAEYDNITEVLKYFGLTTAGLTRKGTAVSRLNKLFKSVKKYLKTRMSRKGINTEIVNLNAIVLQKMYSFEDYEAYIKEVINRIEDYILDSRSIENYNANYNTPQNRPIMDIDIQQLSELCERNNYNFVGYNDFKDKEPENVDVFIDDKYDGKAYIVETFIDEYDEEFDYSLAHELDHLTLELVRDGRISVYLPNTDSFVSRDDKNLGYEEDEEEEEEEDDNNEPLQPTNLMNEYYSENAPLPDYDAINTALPEDDDNYEQAINTPLPDDDEEDPLPFAGEGLRRKNKKFKKQSKNLALLLRELGYRIKN